MSEQNINVSLSREERILQDTLFKEAVNDHLSQTNLTREDLAIRTHMDPDRLNQFLDGEASAPGRDSCLRVVEALGKELNLGFGEQVDLFVLSPWQLGPKGSLDFPENSVIQKFAEKISKIAEHLSDEEFEILYKALGEVAEGKRK